MDHQITMETVKAYGNPKTVFLTREDANDAVASAHNEGRELSVEELDAHVATCSCSWRGNPFVNEKAAYKQGVIHAKEAADE